MRRARITAVATRKNTYERTAHMIAGLPAIKLAMADAFGSCSRAEREWKTLRESGQATEIKFGESQAVYVLENEPWWAPFLEAVHAQYDYHLMHRPGYPRDSKAHAKTPEAVAERLRILGQQPNNYATT